MTSLEAASILQDKLTDREWTTAFIRDLGLERWARKREREDLAIRWAVNVLLVADTKPRP